MDDLSKNGWNCSETAKELRLNKSLLYKKIEKHSTTLGK